MKNTCPKSEKCPIFIGGVLKRKESEQVYRNLYCNAGEKVFTKCKRFIISEKIGKDAPINILPNCTKDVDEIIKIMQETK
jgi:ssDNA-binding Zn-finger/Zn-ribbon topoisomerase 1